MRYRVDRAQALRYLGHAGQQVDALLGARLDEAVERCGQVSNPGFAWRAFPVQEGAEGIRLTGTTLVLTGADIQAHLAGARECAVMAATAGLGNERELQRLSALGGLDGLLFDAAGSVLAEAVADACNAAIVAGAHRRGLYAKWRFSPGYGDLPLALQSGILRVLEAGKRLGLAETDAHLLIPTKSVTALVGLFDTPQDDKRSCANCSFSPYCELRENGEPCCR